MQSKHFSILRWAGAVCMLLLILLIMIEGTWAVKLYHTWIFASLVLISSVLLAIACIRDLQRKAWPLAFSHGGLLFVLIGAMAGAVVKTDVKMVVDKHASERVAYTAKNQPLVLPMAIQLEQFTIDYYDHSDKPKQFTSVISIDGQHMLSTSVNHPARYQGWWIYQSDYDHQQQDFVILQLTNDPWLPVVYIGFLLLVAGAVLQIVRVWHSWYVLLIALLIAAIFTAASLARIELGTLVPALRSLWFFPHILIYMLAYSLLAITFVLAIGCLLNTRHQQWMSRLSVSLFTTASSLLLIGMLCGAVWAKDAWGDYWTWDAKECWAAVTWLLSLMMMHLPLKKSNWGRMIVILLTFAAMQMTWYGVNYLPSAQFSVHTYNK